MPDAPLALAEAWPDWQPRSLPLQGDQCLVLPAPGAAAQTLMGMWKWLGMGAWHTWYRCPALAPIPGGDCVEPAGRLGIHALAETPGQPGWGSTHRSRPQLPLASEPLLTLYKGGPATPGMGTELELIWHHQPDFTEVPGHSVSGSAGERTQASCPGLYPPAHPASFKSQGCRLLHGAPVTCAPHPHPCCPWGGSAPTTPPLPQH